MYPRANGYMRNIKSSVYCKYVYQVRCERNKVSVEEVTAG
jgi:hypothetical protein